VAELRAVGILIMHFGYTEAVRRLTPEATRSHECSNIKDGCPIESEVNAVAVRKKCRAATRIVLIGHSGKAEISGAIPG
tara:strand:- start:809 stop:1045 length:237 start_codon:yes stop_codon:yes gene_type:complete